MKIKMILIMLAMMIAVASKTNAQDLKLIKQYNFYKQFQYGITYFDFIESANKIYLGSPTTFKIYNVATDKFEYSEDSNVDIRVNSNYYFRRIGNEIKKIDPFTNQELFTFSFLEFKPIIWNISEDGNHLISLTEKSGIHWYKECELLVYNTLTNELEKQQSYKLDLPDIIYETDRNFAMDIKISPNGKYALINWERRVDYMKPFESGTMGLDIINLETTQIIKRLSGKRSICFSNTSDTLLISNWYWSKKDNISTFFYDSSNFIQTQTCETLYNGKKINTGNSNKIIGKDIITISDGKLFRINLITMKNEHLASEYRINEFVIRNKKLIACDNEGGYKIAIYDITNITGINESSKEEILYPNPASHLINLNLENNSDYIIQIIDETGKILDSFTISNSYQLNYNTSKLLKGIYILQLNSKNSSNSYKFIVEN